MKFITIGDFLKEEIVPQLKATGHLVTKAIGFDEFDPDLVSGTNGHEAFTGVEAVFVEPQSGFDRLDETLAAIEQEVPISRVLVVARGDLHAYDYAVAVRRQVQVVHIADRVSMTEGPNLSPSLSADERHSIVERLVRAAARQVLSRAEIYRASKYRLAAYERFEASVDSGLQRYDVSVGDDTVVPILASISPEDMRLTVLFSGAVDPMRAQGKPVFQRSSWRDQIQGSVVYIADPTLTQHPSLRIGWGQGANGVSEISSIMGVVEGIYAAWKGSRKTIERVEPLNMYGSSAGGFLALMVGSLVDVPVRVIVNNPQVDWLRYEVRSAVAEVIAASYPGESQVDFRSRHPASISAPDIWMRTRYVPPTSYLVNSASSTDVKLQLEPLMGKLSGLSAGGALRSLNIEMYYDIASGHNPLSKAATLDLLNAPMVKVRVEAAAYGDSSHSTDLSFSALDVNARGVRFGSKPSVFSSLRDFLDRKTEVSGNIEIWHGGLPIHVYWRTGSQPDTTFVSFGGAVTSKVRDVPAFAGYGTSEGLSSNVLLISDPSLIMDRRLMLAWNAGNKRQPDLQLVLTEIIRSLARSSRIVFFGPSGGGFAALEQATRFPGSTVIASNPQTDISRYEPEPLSNYFATAWGISEPESVDEYPFVGAVIQAYAKPVDVNIVYVQNAGDQDHVERHWRPFLASINEMNRIVSIVPDLGPGHIGPDKDSFVRLFEAVVAESDWDALSELLKDLTISRLDAPVAQGRVTESRSSNIGDKTLKTRVFIFGSCVSRDTIEAYRDKYELIQYTARQSWVSAFADSDDVPNTPSGLASKFQERMVVADFRSTFPSELRENAENVDILLMDLVDERGGVLKTENGYVTNSWELSMSAWKPEMAEGAVLELGSRAHFREWSEAAGQLRNLIEELELSDRTMVVRATYASKSQLGQELGEDGTRKTSAQWNDIYDAYYAELSRLGFAVVEVPDEFVVADSDHRWGLRPFHYTQGFYDFVQGEITRAIS